MTIQRNYSVGLDRDGTIVVRLTEDGARGVLHHLRIAETRQTEDAKVCRDAGQERLARQFESQVDDVHAFAENVAKLCE